jgi:membrane protease YdiL (CAAX protease family)
MFRTRSYLIATRHPWACLVFVLPLLVAYEVGVLVLGLDQPELLRNGADVWLRWVLATMGLRHLLWAPSLLLVTLLLWSCRRALDRPRDYVTLWIGMMTESVAFALLLWGGCQLMVPVLHRLGVQLNAGPTQTEPAMQQLLCFVGAGIYEETLFRLLLYSGLRWGLRIIDIPWPGPSVLAALVSALLFSAAHNIGPFGENFQPFVFAFRTAAGLYFVMLFQLRGFGIVVGAHAGYDVLVGLLADF